MMNPFSLSHFAKHRSVRLAGMVLGGMTAVCMISAQAPDAPAKARSSEAPVSVQASEPLLLADASVAPGPVVALPDSSADEAVSTSSSLPDAPSPQLHKLDAPPASPSQAQHVAPIYENTIPAGWRAPKQDVHDKEVMGLRDLYSFDSLGAIALSAAYSHVTNGQPNYGSNSKAFAQRLGAAAARETSQGVFTEMVFAPLLHEDSRYYVMGPSANLFKRTFYSVTRPLITRNDAGRSTVNASLLLGYAGAAALTPAYYPQSNRNFHDVLSTYGGSIGGAALGDFVNEFADDVLEALHLRRMP